MLPVRMPSVVVPMLGLKLCRLLGEGRFQPRQDLWLRHLDHRLENLHRRHRWWLAAAWWVEPAAATRDKAGPVNTLKTSFGLRSSAITHSTGGQPSSAHSIWLTITEVVSCSSSGSSFSTQSEICRMPARRASLSGSLFLLLAELKEIIDGPNDSGGDGAVHLEYFVANKTPWGKQRIPAGCTPPSHAAKRPPTYALHKPSRRPPNALGRNGRTSPLLNIPNHRATHITQLLHGPVRHSAQHRRAASVDADDLVAYVFVLTPSNYLGLSRDCCRL